MGLLVLFEKRMVGAELLEELDGIDRAVPVEVEQAGNAAELGLELLVARADELRVVDARAVDRLIDALSHDRIEVHARGARNLPEVDGERAAHVVLVVGAVVGERHRNEEVRLVVPNEVENDDELLVGRLSQAAAELLHEDDRALRRTQHDHLVDFRDVDAFGEDVDREDVVEAILAHAVRETVDCLFANGLRIAARERNGFEPSGVEEAGELLALLRARAKDESLDARTAPAEELRPVENVRDALLRREKPEVGEILEHAPADRHVLHAEVVEGTQEVFLQRRLEADFIGDVVVEKRVDVLAVGPVGTCRHAEPELRREVGHDLAVALGRRAVHFVDDDHVEGVGLEFGKHMSARERLHRRKDAVGLRIAAPAAEHPVGAAFVAEHPPEACERLARNLLAVHDEEHPAGLELAHREGRGIGLARAGRGNEERTPLARLRNLEKVSDEGPLHRVGFGTLR